MPIHGHKAIGSFSLGENGLSTIAASLLFTEGGKHLEQAEVLSKSASILAELKTLYGEPWFSIPWDGEAFIYYWRSPESLILFAWGGADAWGIHFLSMKLDPNAAETVKAIEEEQEGSK